MWLYGFGKLLVSAFYHLTYRIEVHGAENLPARAASSSAATTSLLMTRW